MVESHKYERREKLNLLRKAAQLTHHNFAIVAGANCFLIFSYVAALTRFASGNPIKSTKLHISCGKMRKAKIRWNSLLKSFHLERQFHCTCKFQLKAAKKTLAHQIEAIKPVRNNAQRLKSAWHNDRYPRHWSTKPASVMWVKTTRSIVGVLLRRMQQIHV